MQTINKIKKVTIAIQARSTSKRFPRKVFEFIEGKTMVQHVVDAAYSSMSYLNYWASKNNMVSSVVLLVPEGDELESVYRGKCQVFAGPEHDVLKRYALMADHQNSDYIVRITADCPMIPANLISKHVQCALKEEYDYLSNVDPDYRTTPDGMDCEVISKRALDWLDVNATEQSDREHVTPLLRRSPPDWVNMGHMVGFLDIANLKLSVDTPEDLERVRFEFHRVKRILETLESKRGKRAIHRF